MDETLIAPHDAFRIALTNFEGPLDLLLHLIREHQVHILDIPIALITEKYLQHLEKMREINLDIAGGFLVMASTLLQLKSRMLLPKEEAPPLEGEVQGESIDPRAELVRRLLEYQKYKHAADQFMTADLLDRDVFARRVSVDRVGLDPDEIGFKEISVFKLIAALDRVLKALEVAAVLARGAPASQGAAGPNGRGKHGFLRARVDRTSGDLAAAGRCAGRGSHQDNQGIGRHDLQDRILGSA